MERVKEKYMSGKKTNKIGFSAQIILTYSSISQHEECKYYLIYPMIYLSICLSINILTRLSIYVYINTK